MAASMPARVRVAVVMTVFESGRNKMVVTAVIGAVAASRPGTVSRFCDSLTV